MELNLVSMGVMSTGVVGLFFGAFTIRISVSHTVLQNIGLRIFRTIGIALGLFGVCVIIDVIISDINTLESAKNRIEILLALLLSASIIEVYMYLKLIRKENNNKGINENSK